MVPFLATFSLHELMRLFGRGDEHAVMGFGYWGVCGVGGGVGLVLNFAVFFLPF